jgi:glycosyltransferase involved in cell wall biosynthesis
LVSAVHILFLTDNFPPEVNAPASRTFEHCREWVKAGHQVTVVTCAPNFPKGKVYEGYRNRPWQSETVDGIRVVRVWSYISANEGFALRTLDYVSYMMSAVLAAPLVRRVDLVVGTSPQFFTACAAYAASRMKRVPYVFELRDLWPESIRAVGAMKEGRALRALERLELFLYRKAARVVSVTRSFKRNLVDRGIDPAKIAVVTNGVDVARFRPRPKDADLVARYGLEGKFVAGYVGTHGMAHALETVLDAAKAFQDAGNDRFRFLLLGDGARKQALVERAGEMGLGNVIFVDSVPKDEVARYWSLIDVSVIHLRKTELFTTVIPSKLFECLGMGIPVLHGVAGESAEIVEREGVGLVFEPENAEALAAGLARMAGDADLLATLRARCLAAAPTYDRSVLALRMLDVLIEAVDGRGHTRNGEAEPADG